MITPVPNETPQHHRARAAMVERRHDATEIAAVREALTSGGALEALGACLAIIATKEAS